MHRLTLEERVERLERQLATISSRLSENSHKPWWEKIAGVFENDPDFEEILALGREIREQDSPDVKS